MAPPSVSVVIVTHDRSAEILSRSIGSVLSQTRPPDEIIVVDSGSEEHRDATGRFVSGLDTKGIPVRVIGDREMRSPEARNLGAEDCSGDYLAFLDDDDEWYPDKLESQLSLSEGMPALIYSPYDEEHSDGFREYSYGPCSYPSVLSRNLVGCTSFPLVRRDIYKSLGGFDESFMANQEWDLWIRILRDHEPVFCGLPAGRKFRSEGITSSDGYRLKGWISLFSKHREEYRENPEEHRKAAMTFYRDMYTRHCLRGILSSLMERMRTR